MRGGDALGEEWVPPPPPKTSGPCALRVGGTSLLPIPVYDHTCSHATDKYATCPHLSIPAHRRWLRRTSMPPGSTPEPSRARRVGRTTVPTTTLTWPWRCSGRAVHTGGGGSDTVPERGVAVSRKGCPDKRGNGAAVQSAGGVLVLQRAGAARKGQHR